MAAGCPAADRPPLPDGNNLLDSVAETVHTGDDWAGYPREAEPYRLWSVLDVLRFFGAAFVNVLTRVNLATGRLSMASGLDDPATRRQLGQALEDLQGEATRVGLSRVLVEQIKRLRAEADRDSDSQVLSALSFELQQNLINEFTDFLFFAVPASRKAMYLEWDEWFGQACFDRFPGIARDVRDACQCFALAQWTATVFHAMRVLERGLHALAVELGVGTPTGLENWKNVLDQIEKRIRAMEAEPKSTEKSERIRFYSEAAVQFRYFKDAWRNHVSHSRTSYDEQSAFNVLTHVKDFMRHLASERPWKS